MNSRISYHQQNTQTVLSSDVIARAVIVAGETRHIISVYAESTDIEFFWVNEEGKKAGTFKKDSGPYKDFNSFVQYLTNLKKGVLESSQIYSAEILSAATIKPEHFTVSADWTPRIASNNPRDFEMQNKRLRRKMNGHVTTFWPSSK